MLYIVIYSALSHNYLLLYKSSYLVAVGKMMGSRQEYYICQELVLELFTTKYFVRFLEGSLMNAHINLRVIAI